MTPNGSQTGAMNASFAPDRVTSRLRTPGWVGGAIGATVGLSSGLLVAGGVGPAEFLVPVSSTRIALTLHTLMVATLGFSLARSPSLGRHSRASLAVSAMMICALCWVLGPLSIAPLIGGDLPVWTSEAAAMALGNLVTTLLIGAVVGTLVASAHGSGAIVKRTSRVRDRREPVRIVVLGGGFGGVEVAKELHRQLGPRTDVDVTLVSKTNSLLFTPMLAEVAGSAIDGRSISAPLRASVPRAHVIRAAVEAVDVEMQSVLLRDPGSTEITVLPYDHLVFALGSRPNFRDIPGLAEHCFSLKSLTDATRLRNHVIQQLERADAAVDKRQRQRLLTFVVAGGGFAGTEAIAELFDLAHGVVATYRRIDPDDLRFVLVHSRTRILPEIGDSLADYALGALRCRGIEVQLGRRVTRAGSRYVELDAIEAIETETLVWAAGNSPTPIADDVSCIRDRDGSMVTDEHLRLCGYANLWAVGDCASVTTPHESSGRCPPTAQYAQRQGRSAGANIVSSIDGKRLKSFAYKPKGTLVALGHRTAVAEIGPLRFAGFVAWVIWRTVYLLKLPGLEKKLRVAVDWTLDLVFSRDVVLTVDDDVPAAEAVPGPVRGSES